MSKHPILCLWVMTMLMTLTACEHINLDDEDDRPAITEEEVTDPIDDVSMPTDTGCGTIDAPYTIGQFNEHYDELAGQTVWVIGYAVGTAYKSMSNATFQGPFQYETNILLSDDCDLDTEGFQQDPNACIPVELKTTKQKRELSLQQNPDMHRECLLIQAMAMTYLKHNALRSIANYHWFRDCEIPTPLVIDTPID